MATKFKVINLMKMKMKKTIIRLSLCVFAAILMSFNVNPLTSKSEDHSSISIGVNKANAIDIHIGSNHCVCKEGGCHDGAWITFRTLCGYGSDYDPSLEHEMICALETANIALQGTYECTEVVENPDNPDGQ